MLPNGPSDPAGSASSAGNLASGSEPVSAAAGGGVPATTAPLLESAPSPRLASLGNRLVAQIVDGLVSLGIFVFFGMLVAIPFGGLTESGFQLDGPPALIAIVVVTILVLVYFTLADMLGATFGKLAAGIRVRTVDGGRVPPRAAVIRNLLRLVDGIAIYLVGALFVLFTKRNQRLGDLVAGTLVVRRESGRALRIAGVVGAAAVAVAGITGGILIRPASLEPTTARPTAGTPRYATAITTDERAGTAEKTVFSPNTPQIFVLFTIADVPPNTILRSVWIAENVQGAPPNSLIDEAQLTAGPGVTGGNFSWSRPTNGHPVGSYRVDLYIADQLAHTVRFRVEGATPTLARSSSPTPPQPTSPAQSTSRPAASIARYATARLTDERTGTTEKTVFSPTTPQLFVHFTIADVPPNTTLRSVWVAESVQGAPSETRMDEATLTTGRDTAGTFSLSRPTAGWPVGQYRVELYIGTQLAQTIRFRVEGAATPTR